MMKDFFISERQLDFAASLGADAVLLLARSLSDADLLLLARGAKTRGMAVVAEAHDSDEIVRAAAIGPDVIGINARDLATFATDLTAVESLARSLPSGPVRVAESGIASRADIVRLAAAGFEAFLVGEALLRSEDPEQTLRELKS